MAAPLVSVSGVRGIVGESFTPELVRRWAGAFAQFCRPEPFDALEGKLREGSRGDSSVTPLPQNDKVVVLGRDTRPSGEWAMEFAAQTIAAYGIQPVILGIVPTPTAQLAVVHHGAAGGLVVTGSHNPAEWNALKFVGNDGVFLSAREMHALHQAAKHLSTHSSAIIRDSSSAILRDDKSVERHVEAVLRLALDVPRIRERHFRVVVDPVNGAGGKAVALLLEKLGCEVVVINGEPTGNFSHPPEPTPAHLTDLAEKVKTASADLGVAVDPDADRLVLVDERGIVLSEEYTVTLAVLSVLSSLRVQPPPQRGPAWWRWRSNLADSMRIASSPPTSSEVVAGPRNDVVVVNLSTTRMVEDVAGTFGAAVVRTPIGERHVVEGMREHRSVIGGEGNGGVIYPQCHEGRDSLVGIALVLDLLVRKNRGLSALASTLPQYVMKKEKLPVGDPGQLPKLMEELRKLADRLPGATVSTLDGVRLDTPDGWVHLRPSNTEPVIRLITEAQTEARVEQLRTAVCAALSVRSA